MRTAVVCDERVVDTNLLIPTKHTSGNASADRCITLGNRACRASRFYRIPLMHATLLGLVKGFVTLIGRKGDAVLKEGNHVRLTDENQAAIAANLARVRLTGDFSGQVKNPFKCGTASLPGCFESAACRPCDGHAPSLNVWCLCRDTGLTMEDWKTFACHTSPIAFHNAGVDPWITQAFGHLRNGITHLITYVDGQHQIKYIDEAQDELCKCDPALCMFRSRC